MAMRADIQSAVDAQSGTSKMLLKAPGPVKKAAKSLEKVLGDEQVRELVVVTVPPAGLRDKMFGTTSLKLGQMRAETEKFLLVLTDSHLIEVHAGGMFSGGPDVTRVPLGSIRAADFDTPRMARSLGTRLNLLAVETGPGEGAVWKPLDREGGERFAALLAP